MARMSNGLSAPPELHGTRQPNAYACLGITFAAATTTLVLRLVARYLTKVSLWYDDWLALVAYVFATAWSGLTLYWLQMGLGLFLSEIDMPPLHTLEQSRLILWVEELLYAFSIASAKLAILGFYWRMFKTSKIRMPIQILAACTVLWLILRTFIAIFHCVPVQKFWQVRLKGHCSIDDRQFFVGSILAHLVIDVAILALPVIEVRKLKMPLPQRLGIMGMFGFGIFVCAASVVTIYLSVRYHTRSIEMPWETAPIIIWATAEVNLSIVSACLPMLRPIYLIIMRHPLTAQTSSYSHSQSNPRSTSASHKLSTLRKTPDVFETESMTKLASREGSVSTTTTAYYNEHGNTTLVTGPSENGEGDAELGIGRSGKVARHEAKKSSLGGADISVPRPSAQWGGIVVTSEMRVTSDKVV
ncbi:hypothetical protein P280DRAFT_508923 [Massarina eburnea CBS 473.64]|uniref:Rhodopsin domain-containing protein n=1 Tax=Massarina eburnea CBS 473.64 TaxID=1395130 RepID=A0A6A6RSW6_9PLEO|nr:hypothetical protein P280DRAFT_508923 [Massarina eburnea CBS 473.64]